MTPSEAGFTKCEAELSWDDGWHFKRCDGRSKHWVTDRQGISRAVCGRHRTTNMFVGRKEVPERLT